MIDNFEFNSTYINQIYEKADVENNEDKTLVIHNKLLNVKQIAEKYLLYLRNTCWTIYDKLFKKSN